MNSSVRMSRSAVECASDSAFRKGVFSQAIKGSVISLRAAHAQLAQVSYIWAQKGRFLQVERIARESPGTADAVSQAIECRMDRLADYIHTITFDRGSEFAEDRRLEKSLKAAIYFADPHSPWQRGCNENLNGLLRQYFPRSRDFSTITMEELQAAEDRLNDRPRKRLGYLTPSEVFFNPNHIALQG